MMIKKATVRFIFYSPFGFFNDNNNNNNNNTRTITKRDDNPERLNDLSRRCSLISPKRLIFHGAITIIIVENVDPHCKVRVIIAVF